MSAYNAKQALKTTKIIFLAILISPLIFGAVVFGIIEGTPVATLPLDDPLFLALVVLSLSMIPASMIVPKKQLGQVKPDDSLQSKMAAYQTAMIMKLAMHEGMALFGIVIFLMSSNLTPLIISLLFLLGMLGFYPSPEHVRKTLNLSEAEYQSLNQ